MAVDLDTFNAELKQNIAIEGAKQIAQQFEISILQGKLDIGKSLARTKPNG